MMARFHRHSLSGIHFGNLVLLASLSLLPAFPLRAQETKPDQGGPAAPAESVSDREALLKRIQELEAIVAKIRGENEALRKQAGVTEGPEPVVTGVKMKPAVKALPTGARWVTSTGKRHNSNCRYYGKGGGHAAKADEGVACKVCGG